MGKGDLSSQFEGPDAGFFAKGARTLVQEGTELVKRACIKESMDGVGTRGARLEGVDAALMEVVDGVADGLIIAAQRASNGGSGLALGAGEEHLAAAQGKGGRGT